MSPSCPRCDIYSMNEIRNAANLYSGLFSIKNANPPESGMSRYEADWLIPYKRKVKAEEAELYLTATKSELISHQKQIESLKLRVQELDMKAERFQVALLKREAATAVAIAADKMHRDSKKQWEDEYSSDEYCRGRKVDKITVAAVKKAWTKEKTASRAAQGIAEDLAREKATLANMETLIAGQVAEVKNAELAFEKADRLAVQDRIDDLTCTYPDNPNQ